MIILITGGIGSGKSVVSRMLRCMGYEVYDCDSRAKALMDGSDEIRRRLQAEISPETVRPDGTINRQLLSQIVFGDPAKLATLNAIVHGAVTEDIKHVAQRHDTLFVETAIPVSSGLYREAASVWEVTAPDELRISRVEKRSGLTREQICARIRAQQSERVGGASLIVNDGVQALLPQVNRLLA